MADIQLSTLGSVIKAAYESEANTNAYTDTEQSKLGTISTDLGTFTVPANTTISTFGATLVDDADAAAARSTLGVDVSIPQAINNQTGTTYTLVLGDAGKLVTCNNASAITLTIPANASVAYDVGTKIDVIQLGAGQVTVALTSDTLRGDTKIDAQYEAVSLVKIAATEWVIVGGAV